MPHVFLAVLCAGAAVIAAKNLARVEEGPEVQLTHSWNVVLLAISVLWLATLGAQWRFPDWFSSSRGLWTLRALGGAPFLILAIWLVFAPAAQLRDLVPTGLPKDTLPTWLLRSLLIAFALVLIPLWAQVFIG